MILTVLMTHLTCSSTWSMTKATIVDDLVTSTLPAAG